MEDIAKKIAKEIGNIVFNQIKGGPGSGFFGHAGRDEQNLRGGSLPREEGGAGQEQSFGYGQAHMQRALQETTEEEKRAFDATFAKKAARSGTEIKELSVKELAHALTSTKYGFVSAGPNPHLDPSNASATFYNNRHAQLKEELIERGYVFTPIVGHFGGTENSYMVMAHDADRSDVIALGKKYDQQTVLYSERGSNEMIQVTDGDFKKGSIWRGQGYELVPKQEDYYSEIKIREGGIAKLSLNTSYNGESNPDFIEQLKKYSKILFK